ncbi:MAG: sodium-translocating pyrophosphatase [Planctomycetes bacterium]|nr:sodium-translocating pyrophosphatase [Planctomycetota bacterium]
MPSQRGRRVLSLVTLALVLVGLFALPALAQEDNARLEFSGPNKAVAIAWILAPIGAVIPLVFAWVFYRQILSNNPGNERMRKIAAAVRQGALAYLFQQYKIVGVVFFVLMIVLGVMAFGFGIQHWLVPWAFLTGGFFSGLCGFLGMNTATQASSRTAQAASENLNRGLQVAFRAGAVMGFVVVGFGLLDICIWFYVCNNLLHMPLNEVVVTMLAFGMGASTQALFARVGGGIYTKAADVGSDLVGKVEAGIPEDDPRNPATIADNVGDNVGDVAGMGADLYESYCGSILSTAALGFATAQSMKAGVVDATASLPWVVYPMIVAGVGNVLSCLSTFAVRTGEDTSLKNLMAALFRGINLATILTALASLAAGWFLLNDSQLIAEEGTVYGVGLFGINNYVWRVWLAVVVGLIAGVIVAKAAEYYTSNDYKPVQGLAGQALTGPATVIIDGVAVGMMSTGIPIITIAIGIFLSFWLADGFHDPIRGLYGISIAAAGMLSTLGITLATDAYGPIADNAGGNAQMSGLDPVVRERTDALDALGNTTAATGKGFAIASAALTAMALLAAYVEEVRIAVNRVAAGEAASATPVDSALLADPRGLYTYENVRFKDTGHGVLYGEGEAVNKVTGKREQLQGAFLDMTPDEQKDKSRRTAVPVREASLSNFMTFYRVNLMNPNVLIGLFIGAMMVFVFCAMTMKAVGRAAQSMVMEVRRQFREIPGIMEGKAEPDYAACVAISTRGAQREMIVPSLIAIAVPILTGLIFDVAGVMGLLAGALSTGFAVAIMMAAAGGAWDNAKKWIESGHLKDEKGQTQGKGSFAHKAAVTGDTVGDPFKDTSGPSLNILIKLMSMVSIVFVGIVVKFSPEIARLWR